MSDNTETAILAGGCFWIMQQLLRHADGVLSTRAGWTGGESEDPTEDNPGGHAEAVEIVFDPDRISYRGLLEFFFQAHRADLDEHLVGAQYRSEIFYTSDLPLGIVAASVIALAERRELDTIATLDHRHFVTVKPRHIDAFTLVP